MKPSFCLGLDLSVGLTEFLLAPGLLSLSRPASGFTTVGWGREDFLFSFLLLKEAASNLLVVLPLDGSYLILSSSHRITLTRSSDSNQEIIKFTHLIKPDEEVLAELAELNDLAFFLSG